MSLYNMINGYDPSTVLILPMLGLHPKEIARFRDCFIGKPYRSTELDQFNIPKIELSDDDYITIYTRTGGGNRNDYVKEIEELTNHSLYIEDYDDEFDSTFMSIVFDVPKEHIEDFQYIKNKEFDKVSREYREKVAKAYPILTDNLLKDWEKEN